MDRALLGNFEQTASLCLVKLAGQFDFTIDAIHRAVFDLAITAILGVNA